MIEQNANGCAVHVALYKRQEDLIGVHHLKECLFGFWAGLLESRSVYAHADKVVIEQQPPAGWMTQHYVTTLTSTSAQTRTSLLRRKRFLGGGMRYHGRISTWKDDRGFGFITPKTGGEQLFVHISSFSSRLRRPVEDEAVTYELGVDHNGRPQAKAVAYAGEQIKRSKASGPSNLPILFAILFLVFVAAVVFSGWAPSAILALYLVASVITFLAYAIDKSAAMQNRWRTQESTLHLFSLAGGWPGAIAAQRILRHKSSKASFQTAFWVTTVLNCGLFGWLLTPQGTKVLRSLSGFWQLPPIW